VSSVIYWAYLGEFICGGWVARMGCLEKKKKVVGCDVDVSSGSIGFWTKLNRLGKFIGLNVTELN
jgi:hypothetical protein